MATPNTPVSQDIKDFLVSASVGIFGTNLFIGSMPDSPDACVAIYDTGAVEESLMQMVYEFPTFQVKVRANAYNTAQTKARAVYDALHGVNNQTKNNARYILIACQAGINFIGPDEKKRPTFTLNFRAHRTNKAT